jgi:hypothetical protein
MREFKKRSYLYVTIMFFAISWLVHGITAYNQFVSEQKEHVQPFEINAFWNEFLRQTAENWQSEFLQLAWQIGGLMILFAVASPQDRLGDQRKGKMLEKLLELKMGKEEYESFMAKLGEKYPEK